MNAFAMPFQLELPLPPVFDMRRPVWDVLVPYIPLCHDIEGGKAPSMVRMRSWDPNAPRPVAVGPGASQYQKKELLPGYITMPQAAMRMGLTTTSAYNVSNRLRWEVKEVDNPERAGKKIKMVRIEDALAYRAMLEEKEAAKAAKKKAKKPTRYGRTSPAPE